MIIAVDAREMVGQIAGKGRYTAEVIKQLATIDHDNSYILYSKQPLELKLPANFTNVIIGGQPGLRQLWLASDAKRRGCQVLFAPTGYLPVIFSRIPSVVTVHDLALFITKDAKPALKTLIAEKLLLGMAARKAKKILAVSQSTKDDLVRLFNTPKQKVTVTPLGYDSTLYTDKNSPDDQKVLKKHSLKPDYLLFIGTLEPRKNIEGIIRAYGQLTAELQAQYPLVIAGKKGWYYDSIFTTVKDLKLEDKIQFLGRVPDEDLPALYRQAKIFLFPSFYEGFGLPVLEALACGTPVISANLSSLPEVVGEAGLLVNPKLPADIASALTILLTDKAKYQTLAQLTTKQAKQFSWQRTAEQTLAAFREVI